MAALKALVIIMAVLILLGLILVFLRIGGVIGGGDEGPALGAVSLDLPPGCRIAEIAAAAGRLFARTEGAEEPCGAVFVIDAASGDVIGTVSP